MTPTLRDVVAATDRLYPPAWASSWDAVGLVCGDPDAPVRRVHFAVDPVEAVVEEAVGLGADLLVTHHPLYLRGTTSVAATDPKGRVVHRLIGAGCGLLVAHTNADVADPGVSDALARAVGLRDLRPLQPQPRDPLDKLVVFVPEDDADALLDALAEAGAGTVGDYQRCAWTTTGTGTFRPLQGANPTIGSVGDVETVRETRLEMVLPRHARETVLRALVRAHPYEEPAYDVLELATVLGGRGLGRVGELPASLSLGELTEQVAAALPATAWGVRAAGDPATVVSTLAVCGGAGDSLLQEAARSGAQAYLTADLRHHPASEAPEGLALLDAAHWATEWPWLADAARRLAAETRVETSVSELVTDPWTTAVRPSPAGPSKEPTP
ncbi:MAG TPA: Nif3-like dinuclear metal center hexameric protein [Mycobacteriales bacterium]|nr:Nif3-like dinuclear metal center hexameric protein [Mycobacteriales bacterium]